MYLSRNQLNAIETEVKRVIIHQKECKAQIRVPLHMLNTSNIYATIDKYSNSLVLQLSTLISENTSTTITEEYLFLPATWWQQFKVEYFPEWLLKYFPIAKKKYTILHEFHTTNICPHLETDPTKTHLEFLLSQEKSNFD